MRTPPPSEDRAVSPVPCTESEAGTSHHAGQIACDHDPDEMDSPEAPDWDGPSDPQSPSPDGDHPVFDDSQDEHSPRSLSDEARERYSSFVRARRASRSKLRVVRGGSKEKEEDDDGSVPTFCPHCNKEYRQNNSFFKHLYEHHPFWQSVAKEHNISKHQQVMLMQTAELLLSLRYPQTYGRNPLVKF